MITRSVFSVESAPAGHPNVCKQKGPSHFGSISLRQDNNGRTKAKLGPKFWRKRKKVLTPVGSSKKKRLRDFLKSFSNLSKDNLKSSAFGERQHGTEVAFVILIQQPWVQNLTLFKVDFLSVELRRSKFLLRKVYST